MLKLEYKQILGNWYWEEKENLLVHKCSKAYKWYTKQIDSEIRCIGCKKEAPQEIVDICLLCNIKPWNVYKTIEGRWGVGKSFYDSKPYLAHQCRGKTWPYSCNATQCGGCETKIPEHIIKYCKETRIKQTIIGGSS